MSDPIIRLRWLAIAMGVVAAAMLLRLFHLQFVAPERVLDLVERSGGGVIRMPAVRGAIRDRDGVLVAADLPSFRVDLAPARWRERSLLEALLDLEVLLGREIPEAREASRRAWCDAERGRARAEALLGVSARSIAVPQATLSERGEALVRPAGQLIRRTREMSYRLRQCLGKAANASQALRASRWRAARGAGGTLAEFLETTAEELAGRVREEWQSLATLGAAIGDEDVEETWNRLQRAQDREWRWIEDRLDEELRRAFFIDELGSPSPGPNSLGRRRWSELAREFDLPFRRSGPSALRAEHAEAGLRSLLGGALPAAIPPAESSAGEGLSEAAQLRIERAVRALDAAEVADLGTSRVRAAWFRERRSDRDFADRSRLFLSARRRHDLIAGLRGGRGFRLGQGTGNELAPQIWGTGALEELGFQLEPSFDRDPAVRAALPPTLRQVLGGVSRRDRKGTHGLEAVMNDRLVGEDGEARREGNEVEIVRPPAHGKDLTLGLSIELCQRFEEILAEQAHKTPAAVAVVDVRTGAIVGLASWPIPPSVKEARGERADLERESNLLRQIRTKFRGEMDRGALLQRIARLEAEGSGDNEAELQILNRIRSQGGLDWLATRTIELNQAKAHHAGWHRAVENPGYSGPGSVFKALTIMAGLEHADGIGLDTAFDCGIETEDRNRHRCKAHGAHISIERALEVSCNEYCYRVGDLIGADALISLYERVGLFDPIPGLLSAAPGWYRANLGRADPKNLSIGGEGISCVPVRAAGIAASIAQGHAVVPWLVPPQSPARKTPVFASLAHRAAIHEGMRRVCGPGGTASSVRGLTRLRIAAKTGTSDYPVRQPNQEKPVKFNEAWFVGFAPYDEPRYAFAALISRTKLEGARAAPIAREALIATAEQFGEVWW